ncbi:class I SAM-dependent methyltransferase [Zavarzinia compransoris]|uniref:O-methyltransferase n=1 Tax=Zavarzinia marina TaxID=2911065 RepID=UPI001F202EE7|nr:class I SAM-dependent methyltransferase [Zavarzinia marina]MCF4166093.1 class I SAM-dependent methyltransferase [Zavarzinia marina]
MNTLDSGPVTRVLDRLHREGEVADGRYFAEVGAAMAASGATLEQTAAGLIAAERLDYRAVCSDHADHFLNVTRACGRFLYMIARACRAVRIVEFGTSMGVSTIYLAAALRDNGGGHLVGSEFEPAKASRARANLDAAGLADLVDIREGDALDTLEDVGGPVDLLLLDGAFALYLPVLRMIEPGLRRGAVILGENAFDPGYLDYVRDGANGYASRPLPIDEGRGNEFTVRTL